MIEYADSIADWGYRTQDLDSAQENYIDTVDDSHFKMSDYSGMNHHSVNVYGVSPSEIMSDMADIDYLSPETGLLPTEQLYTARGSQGAGVYSAYASYVSARPDIFNSTYLLKMKGVDPDGTLYFKYRPLFTYSRSVSYLGVVDF